MKKFLSFLLMFTLILPVFGINSFALNEEIIANGDFETGVIDPFTSMGSSSYKISADYAHDGSYGLLIKDRQSQYSTYYQEVLPELKEQGAGIYTASCWLKLNSEHASTTKGYLVIRFHYTDGHYEYFTANQLTLTTDWQKCTFEGYIDITDDITSVIVYQQSFDTNNVAPDVCVDTISLKKTLDVTFDNEIIDTERSTTTSVGAIRWDAWYSHDGKENSVVSQVERSLSPSQFHFRAPFFAQITDEGNIEMPEYTQDIFDREMEYAMYAGIDYFAYVWYNSDMKMARKFHEQSQYRNDVKMCVCFDGNAINQTYAREEMRTLLQKDYYMTVLDGRPLMYYFATSGNTANILRDIIYYEELCTELGIKKPFAVILNVSSSTAKGSGGNAVSKYAFGGTSTFEDLALACQNGWVDYNNNNFQYVPNITCGWQPEPRYINPVSWTTVADGNWAGYASDTELLDHFAYALSYMQHDSVKEYTMANTVLAYAWNEHDEGGWICPTLEVDENGDQLYNEDGTKQINENRINAVKQAIDFYKSGKTVEVTVNGVSNGSTIEKASDTISNLSDTLTENIFEGIDYSDRINKITGATLDIGSSLTLNYYACVQSAEKAKMRFTSSSTRVTEVSGVYDAETGYVKFAYEGINPQCMTDTIDAELIYDGNVVDTKTGYSVKTYADNILSDLGSLFLTKDQRDALRVLLADMLTYGAESQEYRKYNLTSLANDSLWVDTYKSTFTVPNGVKKVTGNTDANNKVKSVGLNMSNANSIYFKLLLTDETVSITLNDKVVDKSKLVLNKDGSYTLYTDDIYATEFADVYTLKLIKDTTVISTVQYNVNAYIKSKYSDGTLSGIVKALSNYGASASSYLKTFDKDNNFDLEDDIL